MSMAVMSDHCRKKIDVFMTPILVSSNSKRGTSMQLLPAARHSQPSVGQHGMFDVTFLFCVCVFRIFTSIV